MGIPVLAGRSIADRDMSGDSKVAVVNKEFARQYLNGDSPLGRHFGFGSGDHAQPADIEIVGMVGDTKFNDLRREIPPTIFVPVDSSRIGPINFELRTAGDPMALIPSVRRVAAGMDKNLALYQVKSQLQQTEESLFHERLFARLTSLFGLLAGILAAVGVYGVMAFAVSKRTREIGIRMALGATRKGIAGMVLSETLVVTAVAVVIGIAGALAASRLISSLLYGLRPTDPVTLAAAAFLMIAAVVLAGIIPARRASSVEPMKALRCE
ncbi:MAG: hypothetical protein DMG21_20945 [Acidobacteria bacterium]|nr:MAG: hypothetical protein DMG21_20945 [Acidobacteriota bacterium]